MCYFINYKKQKNFNFILSNTVFGLCAFSLSTVFFCMWFFLYTVIPECGNVDFSSEYSFPGIEYLRRIIFIRTGKNNFSFQDCNLLLFTIFINNLFQPEGNNSSR